MGWTSYYATHFKNNRIDRKAELRERFGGDPKWATILKDTMVGSTYYAAMRIERTKEVFALVVLTMTEDNSKFYYKDMDETVGPCYYDCPQGILNLLSPTDNKFALEWRVKCRENRKAKYLRSMELKKIKSAEMIEVIIPECFSNTKYFDLGQKVMLYKMKNYFVYHFVAQTQYLGVKFTYNQILKCEYKIIR